MKFAFELGHAGTIDQSKGNTAISFVFVCLLQAMCIPFVRGGSPTSQQSVLTETVSIRLSRGGDLVYAPGLLNGKDVGVFLIDTGSSWSTVSDAVAVELGARTIGSRTLGYIGASKPARFVTFDRLSLGSILVQNPIFAADAGFPQHTTNGTAIIGVIGMNYLGKQFLTIDYYNAMLSFGSGDNFHPGPEVSKFELKEWKGTPLVRATIEDAPGWFQLDTGSTCNFLMSRDFLISSQINIANRPTISEARPWNDAKPSYLARWSSAEFLGRKITNSFGGFCTKSDMLNDVAGIIGANSLRDATITIDIAGHDVWVRRAPAESIADFNRRFPDVHSKDLAGFTPLLQAAFRLDHSLVKTVLERGGKVDESNDAGITSLMVCAGRGDVGSMQELLSKGANPNACCKSGYSALMFACQYGKLTAAQLLLKAGADAATQTEEGRSPLFIAIDAGNLEVARLLVENGGAVNCNLRTGETPLIAAAHNGDAEGVRLLLDHGANPNVICQRGTTLSYAARAGSLQCMQALLEHGAKVDQVAGDGTTALSAAVSQDNPECVSILLRHGAKLAEIYRNQSLLEHAVEYGSPRVLQLLIDAQRSQLP